MGPDCGRAQAIGIRQKAIGEAGLRGNGRWSARPKGGLSLQAQPQSGKTQAFAQRWPNGQDSRGPTQLSTRGDKSAKRSEAEPVRIEDVAGRNPRANAVEGAER